MKYLLLMYANEANVPPTLEEQQAAAPSWQALTKEMEAAGILLAMHGSVEVGPQWTPKA